MFRDKKYEKAFALRVINSYKDLHFLKHNFETLWSEYNDYVKMIPSFGAIMFSKKFMKILTSKSIYRLSFSSYTVRTL